MLSEGFPNWTQTDFLRLTKALKEIPINNFYELSLKVTGKTPTEIEAYVGVLRKRYASIKSIPSFAAMINCGVEERQRQEYFQQIIVENLRAALKGTAFKVNSKKRQRERLDSMSDVSSTPPKKLKYKDEDSIKEEPYEYEQMYKVYSRKRKREEDANYIEAANGGKLYNSDGELSAIPFHWDTNVQRTIKKIRIESKLSLSSPSEVEKELNNKILFGMSIMGVGLPIQQNHFVRWSASNKNFFSIQRINDDYINSRRTQLGAKILNSLHD